MEFIFFLFFVVIAIVSTVSKARKGQQHRQQPPQAGRAPQPQYDQRQTRHVQHPLQQPCPEDLPQRPTATRRPVRPVQQPAARQLSFAEQQFTAEPAAVQTQYASAPPVQSKPQVQQKSVGYLSMQELRGGGMSKDDLRRAMILGEILRRPKPGVVPFMRGR